MRTFSGGFPIRYQLEGGSAASEETALIASDSTVVMKPSSSLQQMANPAMRVTPDKKFSAPASAGMSIRKRRLAGGIPQSENNNQQDLEIGKKQPAGLPRIRVNSGGGSSNGTRTASERAEVTKKYCTFHTICLS